MAFKLKIEYEAQMEIDDAIEYYESKRTGLGEEFFELLEEYYETLRNEIADFEIKRKPSYRELPLRRFPYVIIYELVENTIYVYSVFNTNQDPDKKRK